MSVRARPDNGTATAKILFMTLATLPDLAVNIQIDAEVFLAILATLIEQGWLLFTSSAVFHIVAGYLLRVIGKTSLSI